MYHRPIFILKNYAIPNQSYSMLDCLLIKLKTPSYPCIAYIIMNRIYYISFSLMKTPVSCIYRKSLIKLSQCKTSNDYLRFNNFVMKLYKR